MDFPMTEGVSLIHESSPYGRSYPPWQHKRHKCRLAPMATLLNPIFRRLAFLPRLDRLAAAEWEW